MLQDLLWEASEINILGYSNQCSFFGKVGSCPTVFSLLTKLNQKTLFINCADEGITDNFYMDDYLDSFHRVVRSHEGVKWCYKYPSQRRSPNQWISRNAIFLKIKNVGECRSLQDLFFFVFFFVLILEDICQKLSKKGRILQEIPYKSPIVLGFPLQFFQKIFVAPFLYFFHF